jgi:serine/threonine-protein kinase
VANLTPRILAGRYEVGELIGRGGMAEVHVGRDTRLGRTVAIKLLRSDLARDPAFQNRFRREAQAAASLNHPAIVSVYDTGEDVSTDVQGVTHHVPYIIMEYVEGHTLRELMRDGAALPIDEATDITIGVLSALQYAHHAGIVHRDIKPGNIMLTASGQVKVMDFGIARALAETSDAVTQTQSVIGTAQYLSPEQARGETVDARSDLYSTGCVLFELLTGRPPFVGDSAVAVAYQHVREQADPPSNFAPDVPAVMDQIVMKALTKNRDQRYSTASEFLADLQAAKHGGRVSAPPVASANTEATQVLSPAVLGAPSPTSPAAFARGAVAPDSFQNAGILPPSDVIAAEEEAEAQALRKRRIIIWAIVGVVVTVLVVVGALLLTRDKPTDPGPSAPVQMTIPAVPDSRTVEDSVAVLKKNGFKAEAGSSENSNDVPAGQVVRFDPKSGSKADQGSVVKYVISLGADSISVPATATMSQEQARAALTKAGLKVASTTTTVNSPTVPKDMVVGTEPAAGAVLKSGEEVTLLISTGKTVVPQCAAKPQAECSTLLSDAGLNVLETSTEESDEPEGTVIRLEPGADQLVDQGTRVKMVVAKPKSMVTIPGGLTGSPAANAQATLESLEFKVAQRNEASTEYAAGIVIRTEPAQSEKVPAGSTVTLVVSSGPGPNSGTSPAPQNAQ